MTFSARTARRVIEAHRSHVNELLSTTITRQRLLAEYLGDRRASIALRDRGSALAAQLNTRFGPLVLFVGQHLLVETDGGSHVLMLVSYRYALGHNQGSEPVFRWESSSPDLADRALWNRFHVQGAVAVSLSTRRPPVSLNDLHLPTGAIPIEDVIRFCIVDLGVTPLSDDWDARLRESRRLTRELQSE